MAPAFIVDGFLEKKIVQRLCKGAPVRMTNLNGNGVSIEALGKAIGSLISLLQQHYSPIIVVTDREGRELLAIQMEDLIRQHLVQSGHRQDNLVVSVSDRMTENWILSGLVYPDELNGEYKGCCDGCNGKRHLKEICKRRGFHYDETVVGVELFCSLDFSLARQRSPSFERFAARMELFCRQFVKNNEPPSAL